MISYQLTDDDLISAHDLWWRHQQKPFGLACFFLVIAVAATTLLVKMSQKPLLEAVIVGAIIGISGLGGLLYFGIKRSRRITLDNFRALSSAREETTVEWDATHIAFRQNESYQKSPWSDVRAWRESDDVIVLMRVANLFSPIPKRAFDSQALSAFRETITNAGIK